MLKVSKVQPDHPARKAYRVQLALVLQELKGQLVLKVLQVVQDQQARKVQQADQDQRARKVRRAVQGLMVLQDLQDLQGYRDL